jgi:hypothetical protein
MPIEDCHQVEPSGKQPNVGDVDASDLIAAFDDDFLEQVGINPMLKVRLRQVRTRRDAFDAHFPQITLHPLAVDGFPLALQLRRQSSRAVKRISRVEFIEAMLEPHFLRGRRRRLVIQTGTRGGDQFGLCADTQFQVGMRDQRPTLI